MSILIKGVEMPVSCAGCPCANDESRYCHAAIKYIPMLGRPDFCPLAEVEERRKGEWILVTDNNGQHFVCDQCGEWRYHQEQRFCGECGADMRKGEGEKE